MLRGTTPCASFPLVVALLKVARLQHFCIRYKVVGVGWIEASQGRNKQTQTFIYQ